MIFYYSGCGNSRFAAEEMSRLTGDERLLFIPDVKDGEFEIAEGEALGFVFPVYAWAPPKLVEQFLDRIRLRMPRHPYTYMLVTCGDEAGLTDKLFAEMLQQKLRVHLDAAFSLIMPETYLNFPGFHLDSPEGERGKIEAARKRMQLLADRVKRHDQVTDVTTGSMSWLKSHPIAALFNATLMTDRNYRVEESCVGCGICAKSCPVHNIEMEKRPDGALRPKFLHSCVACCSCYHRCPQNAIQYGRNTRGKGQYYFGHQ